MLLERHPHLVNMEEEHVNHLPQVFRKLSHYGVVINTAKCIFGVFSMEYIGLIIRTDGISIPASRVEQQQPRDFLGTLNFYRRFIRIVGRSAGTSDQVLVKR